MFRVGVIMIMLAFGPVAEGAKVSESYSIDAGVVLKFVKTRQFDKALAFWQSKAEQYANKNGRYEVLLGKLLMDNMRFSEAEKYLIKALDIGVRYPGLYPALSKLYYHKGDLAKAEHWAEKAVREYPSIGNGYRRLVEVRFAQRRFKEALELTKKEVEVQPNPVGYLRQGNALVILGRHEEAIAPLLRARELWPDYKGSLVASLLLADAYYHVGEAQTAKDIVEELWRLNPRARGQKDAVSLMEEIEAKLRKKGGGGIK